MKGTQAAFIVFSLAVHLPIDVIHSHNNCYRCTKALNEARAEGKVDSSTTNYLTHMKHDGKCTRSASYGPGSAEEHQAGDSGKRLLLDASGKYHGDDVAIFVDQVVADNDTRGPDNFIATQAEIIGPNADGIADHLPDIGHVIKLISNSLYKVRAVDPSFSGKDLLEPPRIRAMMADLRRALSKYSGHIGVEIERKECIKIINAIVPHHCGDHSACNISVCKFLQIKKECAGWTDQQVKEEHAKGSRFKGRYMALSTRGTAVLQEIFLSRFKEGNVDRVAKLCSSNDCENFFGRVAKLSEGKRLNLENSDLWKSMVLLAAASCGHEEATKFGIAEKLGLRPNSVQKKASAQIDKKRKRNHEESSSQKGKDRRKVAKMTQDVRRGKSDQKGKRHISGKVPLTDSAKTTAKKEKAARRPRPCPNCGDPAHTKSACTMPPMPAKTAREFTPALVDWTTLLK